MSFTCHKKLQCKTNKKIVSLSKNLNFLFQSNNVFVMDNHLAAGWCWLNVLDAKTSYDFLHIDAHPDLINTISSEASSSIKVKCSLKKYLDCICKQNNCDCPDCKPFVWNTYIKNIQKKYPNWFSENHFATHEVPRDTSKNRKLKIKEIRNPIMGSTFPNSDRKLIVNLDLDYFFFVPLTGGNPPIERMFSDQYIRDIAFNINSAMDEEKIAVLTIAFSPECCGGWYNAIEAYKIFSKEISSLNTPEVHSEIENIMEVLGMR